MANSVTFASNYTPMKHKILLISILFTLIIQACQTDSANQNIETEKAEKNNIYQEKNVKLMYQYAHDLAFYAPEDKGRLIQTTHFNEKGEVIKIVRYDKTGKICFSEKIDPDNTKPEINRQKTNLRDDSVTVKNFNPEGKLVDRASKTYNEQGQKTSLTRVDKNGKVIEKITYKYYPNGLIKQDIYWNPDIDKPEQIINYEYEYFGYAQ